jgi:hypothetical protein
MIRKPRIPASLVVVATIVLGACNRETIAIHGACYSILIPADSTGQSWRGFEHVGTTIHLDGTATLSFHEFFDTGAYRPWETVDSTEETWVAPSHDSVRRRWSAGERQIVYERHRARVFRRMPRAVDVYAEHGPGEAADVERVLATLKLRFPLKGWGPHDDTEWTCEPPAEH